MADKTVTSSADYEFVVDSDMDASGTNYFRLHTGPDSILSGHGSGGATTAPRIEYGSAGAAFHGDDGVGFWTQNTDSAVPTAIWETGSGGQDVAVLGSDGVLDLSLGSIRLPIVTTLPSSPVEGQIVIYYNAGPGWTRLAAYIDGGWRMSADL